MLQFPGRFLILIGMAVGAVGAVCNLQSSAEIAGDSATVAPFFACDWAASCGNKAGSGTVHGFNMPDDASAAATQAAIDWCNQNCGTNASAITVGEPFEEAP